MKEIYIGVVGWRNLSLGRTILIDDLEIDPTSVKFQKMGEHFRQRGDRILLGHWDYIPMIMLFPGDVTYLSWTKPADRIKFKDQKIIDMSEEAQSIRRERVQAGFTPLSGL